MEQDKKTTTQLTTPQRDPWDADGTIGSNGKFVRFSGMMGRQLQAMVNSTCTRVLGHSPLCTTGIGDERVGAFCAFMALEPGLVSDFHN
jgi:hypothetical protein